MCTQVRLGQARSQKGGGEEPDRNIVERTNLVQIKKKHPDENDRPQVKHNVSSGGGGPQRRGRKKIKGKKTPNKKKKTKRGY